MIYRVFIGYYDTDGIPDAPTVLMDTSLNTPEATLIDPVLTIELSEAGSFEFTILPGHPQYDNIEILASTIWVCADYVPLWIGRPIEMEEDFYRRRKYYCEGALAYLNDSIQPQKHYSSVTVLNFLNDSNYGLLTTHSHQTRFSVFLEGSTCSYKNTVITRYTNRETTLEAVRDKLLDRLGGYMMVVPAPTMHQRDGEWTDDPNDPLTWDNYTRPFVLYLRYLSLADLPTSGQSIEFGSNLLDYVRRENASEVFTDILPLGQQLEDEFLPGIPEYLTIATTQSPSEIMYSQDLRDFYEEKIVKVVSFDDIDNRADLVTAAQDYLAQAAASETISLEVTALDLSNADANIEMIAVGSLVHVVSAPHNLDTNLVCTKRVIPLLQPENETITLGASLAPSITKQMAKGQ